MHRSNKENKSLRLRMLSFIILYISWHHCPRMNTEGQMSWGEGLRSLGKITYFWKKNVRESSCLAQLKTCAYGPYVIVYVQGFWEVIFTKSQTLKGNQSHLTWPWPYWQ